MREMGHVSVDHEMDWDIIITLLLIVIVVVYIVCDDMFQRKCDIVESDVC